MVSWLWGLRDACILASMKRFDSAREAKEYLIGLIVAQADGDGVALSDVERKMLYFSETAWTLPDMMAVSREFDETYDQDAYEDKIGGIVGRIFDERDGGRADEDWDRAVALLAREDHYLLVLIAVADRAPAVKGRWDRVRLILAGLVVVEGSFAVNLFIDSQVQSRVVAGMFIGIALTGLVVLVMTVGNRRSGR